MPAPTAHAIRQSLDTPTQWGEKPLMLVPQPAPIVVWIVGRKAA